MEAMEGVEVWLLWALLVSAQSRRRHHTPARGEVARAKWRGQPGWWIQERRGETPRNLALWSRIAPLPSPCDRLVCCRWWISWSYNLSFLEKFTLLTNRPFGIRESDHLALRELRAATALFCHHLLLIRRIVGLSRCAALYSFHPSTDHECNRVPNWISLKRKL